MTFQPSPLAPSPKLSPSALLLKSESSSIPIYGERGPIVGTTQCVSTFCPQTIERFTISTMAKV